MRKKRLLMQGQLKPARAWNCSLNVRKFRNSYFSKKRSQHFLGTEAQFRDWVKRIRISDFVLSIQITYCEGNSREKLQLRKPCEISESKKSQCIFPLLSGDPKKSERWLELTVNSLPGLRGL